MAVDDIDTPIYKPQVYKPYKLETSEETARAL